MLGATPRLALTKLNAWRATTRTPDLGDYWVTAKTRNAAKTFSQFGIDNLSDYEPKQHVLLNLGYSRQLRKTIDVTFNATKQINFKSARLIAVPFGKAYNQQVHRVQRRGLQHARVTNNQITGDLTTGQTSVMTTSVPYSTGWQLTVDGRPTQTLVVNDGLLALGRQRTHRIVNVPTPGLKPGWMLTVGLIGLAGEVDCGIGVRGNGKAD